MKAFIYIGSAVFLIILLSVFVDSMKGMAIDLNNYMDEAVLGAAIGIFFYFRDKKRQNKQI